MNAALLRSLRCAAALTAWFSPSEVLAQTLLPLAPAGPGQPVRLSIPADKEGKLLRLEGSPDLAEWTETGRFHDALFPYADLSAAGLPRRYYRAWISDRAAGDDWKNQVVFPEDSFRSALEEGENPRWVKFILLTDEPGRVYFQDSARYPFHYEFATARLAPFAEMTRAEFDAVSLRREGRRAVPGAILFPPRSGFQEYAVQFTGLDPHTPEETAGWFRAVRNAVHDAGGGGASAMYMPVYEQQAAARRDAAELERLGVPLISMDRWTQGHSIYAPGWALGRLKFFPAGEIEDAFAEGRLTPEDILLTDGVPAETPPVAGIISLEPGTPNSHTAILAQSFGIPFVYLSDPAEQARARALDGRKVILRAVILYDAGTVKLIDTQDTLPSAVEAELLALKAPQPILYSPKTTRGALSEDVTGLRPEDIRSFGGKAVNYGLLRRTIPENSPRGIAFSFDLWDAFMDQTPPGLQRTLRAEIAARLAPHSTWPPQMAPSKTTLAGIRELIRKTAVFPAALRTPVIDALADFTPGRKIRFRSSTNVEDGSTFTGAGLYDSYSGCLLDDLDADNSGPCRCEAGEPEERGVFRAIQRVYASFYNDNAYLERLRHGVREKETAMGVLAHHSYPDEEELANGVATLDYRYTFSETMDGPMVTQAGAESVTNPTGGILPEIVDLSRYGDSTYPVHRQGSSKVPLGGRVMTWDKDYTDFSDLFKKAGDAWRALTPERTQFRLDFEYKKDLNLGLIVKQVREIPVPAQESVMAWLIEEPVILQVAQQESGDVFSNHRLKSRWTLHTGSGRLTPEFLAAGLYRQGSLEHLENGASVTLSGALSTWPSAAVSPSGTTHTWTTGSGTDGRKWTLETEVVNTVTGGRPPLLTAGDYGIRVSVKHAAPQASTDHNGAFITTREDGVTLEAPRPLTPGCKAVERVIEGARVSVNTRFFWPDEPPSAGGYTAPLVKFDRTVITGLTSRPLTLTGYYSQTYRPGHHNFTEEFIFEPALEPGIPEVDLAALRAADIRYLHLEIGFTAPRINAVGLDGKPRRL